MVKLIEKIGVQMRSLVVILLFSLNIAQAAKVSVPVYATNDNKTYLGQVNFHSNPNGVLILPQLSKLPVGIHGFHLHEKGLCGDDGMAAGGHFDPKGSKSHQGPYGNGHLGDLPVLAVDNKGHANIAVIAPRLKLSDLKGLALMIHQGGDNYSNTPKLGGGGSRIGCGVIK
jgi:superoxide dismutase, Cu-Zn family